IPPVDIPKFDGDYLKWPRFCDIFTELVHNQEYSDAVKFRYLENHVIGEAKNLISTTFGGHASPMEARHPCRAVFDSGSQVNLISQELADKLGVQSAPSNLTIRGIGGIKQATSRTVLNMFSLTTNFKTQLVAYVLPEIMTNQPSESIMRPKNIPPELRLADPKFNQPQGIDLLLGAECLPQLIEPLHINLGQGQPLLQRTPLGWIISGPATTRSVVHTNPPVSSALSTMEEPRIDRLLEQFWKLDTLDETKRSLTTDEKLQRDPDLQKQYVQFMDQYEELGHMTRLTTKQLTSTHYVIPHHCVLKPDSSTTKLRVVFDASATTTSGKSLNNLLRIGPTVQSELLSILLRFRSYQYVFTSDVEKMYRQIMIHPDNRKFQIILWRRNLMEPLKYYQLNTVTYGTATAPYLATRCLQYLADTAPEHCSQGAAALRQGCYVDDCLTGGHTIDE
ncbi:hypothetical protein KR067_001133, partial [Drosophila pandora]